MEDLYIMFCKSCGYQLDDNATVCPNCEQAKTEQPNAAVSQQEYPAAQQNFNPYQQVDPAYMINPVAQRYNGIFSDSLFLVSCICISISTVLGFISGSIDVLNILFTIFMWLTYSSAKSGRISATHLRRTSGAVYALRIIIWILVGVLGLAAIGSFAASGFLVSILSESSFGSDLDDIGYLLGGGGVVLSVVLLIAFLIVAAMAVLVNIFFYGNLHKLAKAFYISVETGNEQLPNIGVIKTLLLVFGILSGIGALGQLPSIAFIASAASAANYIILSVWLKKNFVKIGYSN